MITLPSSESIKAPRLAVTLIVAVCLGLTSFLAQSPTASAQSQNYLTFREFVDQYDESIVDCGNETILSDQVLVDAGVISETVWEYMGDDSSEGFPYQIATSRAPAYAEFLAGHCAEQVEARRRGAEVGRRIRKQRQEQRRQEQASKQPESKPPVTEPESSEQQTPPPADDNTDSSQVQKDPETSSSNTSDYKYPNPEPIITSRPIRQETDQAAEFQPETEASPETDQDHPAESGDADDVDETQTLEVVPEPVDEVVPEPLGGGQTDLSSAQGSDVNQANSSIGNARCILWAVAASIVTLLILSSLALRRKKS